MKLSEHVRTVRTLSENEAESIADDIAELESKLDKIRDVIYEQFSKGKCSELVAVGLIEKIVREPK